MTKRETLRSMLKEGRHRLHVGREHEAAQIVLANPRRMNALVACLFDEDRGVANRAAGAIEKITRTRPALAAPWKSELLGRMAEADENKLRWNLASTIGRLPLTAPEARTAASLLRGWLDDKSSIVKTASMQGLADLARRDPSFMDEALDMLRILSRSGTPAMRARGRILLQQMNRLSTQPVVQSCCSPRQGA